MQSRLITDQADEQSALEPCFAILHIGEVHSLEPFPPVFVQATFDLNLVESTIAPFDRRGYGFRIGLLTHGCLLPYVCGHAISGTIKDRYKFTGAVGGVDRDELGEFGKNVGFVVGSLN
jgi:hypothetical protein